jgi:hypothetical protein
MTSTSMSSGAPPVKMKVPKEVVVFSVVPRVVNLAPVSG